MAQDITRESRKKAHLSFFLRVASMLREAPHERSPCTSIDLFARGDTAIIRGQLACAPRINYLDHSPGSGTGVVEQAKVAIIISHSSSPNAPTYHPVPSSCVAA